jgi:putative hemolysin
LPDEGGTRVRIRIRCFYGILLLGILLVGTVAGMLNPAAVYCTSLGYQYQVVTETDGGERGYCQVPGGEAFDAWQFLEGRNGTPFNYCSRLGYATRTMNDWSLCERFGTGTCSACVLENGTVIEVTNLMQLDFNESVCGDGVCAFPEDAGSCPHDCPHSGADGLCETLSDGICDRDCAEGEDADCSAAAAVTMSVTKTPLELISVLVALASLISYSAIRRKR